MKCTDIRSLFSSYLDGALTGGQMQKLSEHLEGCPACTADYTELRRTQQMVAALGRKRPPADLALKLRVAISREAALRRQRAWNRWSVRLENALNGFMIPATAGLVSAVIFFGVMIGFFALPSSVSAADQEVPIFYTPPQLATVPVEPGIANAIPESLVVETLVDAKGRVQEYRIISGPKDASHYTTQLDNVMIFTTFRPATSFGRPTVGRAVVSFAKINVKG
ncbi:MAG: zf-HC2 domain-containing protein [Acidobacteriia bacterium]|nr:zf-HC2 domain-containing protein [Terriglobia bacterium]